jgi:RepB DNA-primase from phage plasmid
MTIDRKFATHALTAPEYVRALFLPLDNAAILVRNRATGRTVQTIAKAEIIAGAPFQNWLAYQNSSGCDVFLGMNPIKDGAYSRTKQNIQDIRHVYLDLDRKGDEALETIRNSAEVPAPNFVLDTSPGKHQVVWKVSGLDLDDAEALLHHLANRFGGDLAATDATRVLRLPGFANRKIPGEFIVQARQESDAVHTLRDFTIDEDSPEPLLGVRDNRRGERNIASDHKSQSERDWAYAKRALSRADDPEAVIERIAAYRSEDKADPRYYARLTVTKALADLMRTQPNGERAEDPEAERKVSGSPGPDH